MGNRNLAVLLFGLLTFGALLISAAGKPQAGASISGEAKSPSDLGGNMPPSFDRDVARVVADIDRIEANTLSQMEHTALDRPGQNVGAQPSVQAYNPYPPGILPSDLNPEIDRVRRELRVLEQRALERWHALKPPLLRGQPTTTPLTRSKPMAKATA